MLGPAWLARLGAVTLLGAALTAAMSAAGTGAGTAAHADDYPSEITIVMRNNTFYYDFEIVAVGATVTWRNDDSGPRSTHNVLSDDGTVASPRLRTGDTWSFTFNTEGYFHYVCELHRDMEAAILVVNLDSGDSQ